MKNHIITLGILSVILFTACQEKKIVTEESSTPVTEKINDTTPSNPSNEDTAEFKIISNSIIENLNKTIASKQITSEEEIMRLYSPKSTETEGNYKYMITEVSGNGKTIVQLVEENIMDDSIEGKKVIMRIIKNNNDKPIVDEIKESYRCRLNRGSQDWSAAMCQ